MPRKKSAAKKAREEKEKELAKRISEVPADKPLPLDIEELKRELREEEISEEDEEDEEEEDDFGELLTEDVENGLNEVLKAIKTGDQRLFDSNVKFFKEEDSTDNGVKKEGAKPIYLKEYHRKALLEGDDEESGNFASIDGKKTYVDQQREDKEDLIKQMHGAISDDDSDDDFLIKKEQTVTNDPKPTAPVSLPDPEKEGGEKFLEAFLENHAWLPDKGEKVDVEFEDDAEFDQAAETFENAYNFRFEDPKATEIISYARSQATMRREKMNSRKRERLKEQEKKMKEKEEIKEELKKKKQKKVNLVVDRIKEIRQIVGDEISEERILKVFGDSLMKEDFSSEDWDAKMAEIFDEEYYQNENDDFVKPEWDDDLMNDDIRKEDESEGDDDENEEILAEDVEAGNAKDEDDGKTDSIDNKAENSESKSRKSKKKEEKYTAKKEKNKVKEIAEKLVEKKTLDILDEVEEERGRNKEKKYTFKYREVSPESFGLTANEILAADDKALNELIGLKKLAPYRPHDKVAKDKRKITKSKNLREWRKKTFGTEVGITDDADLDIKIPSIVFDSVSTENDGPNRKKRKTNKSKSRR